MVHLAEAQDAENTGVQQRAKQVCLPLELLHFILVVPHIVLCSCVCINTHTKHTHTYPPPPSLTHTPLVS